LNFFEHQDKARKSTGRLVFLFGMAVAGIVVALYFVTVAAFFAKERQHTGFSWWQFGVFWKVAAAVVLVIFLCSLSRISSLSAGGSAVAEMMGGRRIESATRNQQERVLVNVVEEIAIASGVPVPAIYVIDSDGINAFAAGYSPDDAAVAVTQGCLDLLNRDELQGVMAHEFSHILNGDMRLNIRLMGVLAGILIIGYAGQFIMRTAMFSGHRRRSSKDNSAIAFMVFGLLVFIIGFIGVFFGNMIKAAVSRQREYLADASAVQFTRNNLGIAGALKKIGSHTYGSTVESSKTAELSHMFFANALSGASFATHPPLPDRIKRLDPAWEGDFPALKERPAASSDAVDGASGAAGFAPGGHSPPPPPEERMVIPATPSLGRMGGMGAMAGLVNAAPGDVVAQVGNPSQEHLDYGKQLVMGVPENISEAAHAPMSAVAVIYGLLLDEDAEMRKKQLQAAKDAADPGVFKELIRLTPGMVALDARARLPVLELTIPALRQMSSSQYNRMMRNVDTLIRADAKLSLFEFTLHKIMKRRLEGTFGKPSKKSVQFYSPKPLAGDFAVLLSGLAHVGNDDSAEAASAFAMGVAKLPSRIRESVQMLPKAQCTFAAINTSIDRLDLASAPIKQQLVDAAAHCVLADQEVTVDEGELLRAICDTLGAPMPPFLPKVA